MLGFLTPSLATHQTDRTVVGKHSQAAGEGVKELRRGPGVPVPSIPQRPPPFPRSRAHPVSQSRHQRENRGQLLSPHRQHRHSTRGSPQPFAAPSFPTPRWHLSRGSAPGDSAAEGRRDTRPRRGHTARLGEVRREPRGAGPRPQQPGLRCWPGPTVLTLYFMAAAPRPAASPRALSAPPRAAAPPLRAHLHSAALICIAHGPGPPPRWRGGEAAGSRVRDGVRELRHRPLPCARGLGQTACTEPELAALLPDTLFNAARLDLSPAEKVDSS